MTTKLPITEKQPFVRVDEKDSSLWLEPDPSARYFGLCLGTGATLAEQIADARESVKRIEAQLDEIEETGQNADD